MYHGICDAIHRELELLDDKLMDGKVQLTGQDLEHIDKMAHALKSLATYEAMQGSSEDGRSYARGRSRTTGRYVSRDGYPRESYADPDGYGRRY